MREIRTSGLTRGEATNVPPLLYLFTFRFFLVHKFIIASLVRISTLLAEFLQDRTIILQYRLIALSP